MDYGCGGRGEESGGGGGDGGRRMGAMYGRGRRVCGGIITYIAILTQACFQDCPGQPGVSSAQDRRARSNKIKHRKHSKLVPPNSLTNRIVGADVGAMPILRLVGFMGGGCAGQVILVWTIRHSGRSSSAVHAVP